MIISRTLRIIHLDDHKLFHAGLRSCLTKQNPEISIQHYQYSHHAFDAISQCIKARQPIDLIITDFTHMGENGYEFAKAVRSFERSHFIRTPILLLTMHHPKNNDFLRRILQEEVFDAYLPKSANCVQLLATIEELIAIRMN